MTNSDAPEATLESRFGAPCGALSTSQWLSLTRDFRDRGGLGSGGRGLLMSLATEAMFSSDLEGRRRAARQLGLGGKLRRTKGRLALLLKIRTAPINPLHAAICAEAYGWKFRKTTDHALFGAYSTPDHKGMVGVYQRDGREVQWPQEDTLPDVTMFAFRTEAEAIAYADKEKAFRDGCGPDRIVPLMLRASSLVVHARPSWQCGDIAHVRDSLAAWLSDCLISFAGSDAEPVVVMEPMDVSGSNGQGPV